MYDSRTGQESAIIHAIILFKNTSSFHEKEEQEKERLEAAFQEADLASRTKTEFLNRISHDIRTPINGIIGMLEIIKRSRTDERKVDECLDKIRISISHLLALVNDVLDMSKIKDESTTLEQEKFELEQLMEETDALVSAQLLDMEITYHAHRERAMSYNAGRKSAAASAGSGESAEQCDQVQQKGRKNRYVYEGVILWTAIQSGMNSGLRIPVSA